MTRRSRITVPGFDEVDPYWQGSLDRMCGSYSVINAALLAAQPHQPLTGNQTQRMHDSGVRFLAQEEHLRGVSLYGLGERRWCTLRNHMFDTLRKAGGPRLETLALPVARTMEGKAMVALITEQIDLGHPVLMALWGAYDHFTVVAGYTATQLILFDSYGYTRVRADAVRVRAVPATTRHRISPGSVAAIRMAR
jgi:hypothetical protein